MTTRLGGWGLSTGLTFWAAVIKPGMILFEIAGKRLTKRHVAGPQGVRGRNSDNRLIKERLGWTPGRSLRAGLEPTYKWIETQVMRNNVSDSPT